MKKNFGTILAIALGLSALLLTIAFQAGWVNARPFAQQERAGAPTIVSYQGQIWDGDEPYGGTGYFKFAIVDADGTTTYWSNDGTSTEGTEPTASISLEVENGLFSLLLGDTSLPNMTTALDETSFSNPNTYLRIWFSADGFSPWAQLPDQKIASVPYALQAEYSKYADTASLAISAGEAFNSQNLGDRGPEGYQWRVTGTCPIGQAVRAINSGGSVECETIPKSPKFSLSTVDSPGSVGQYTSIAIGTDGLGLISYYDFSHGGLKVAHCNDTACNSADSYTLDSNGNVGMYTSIAIGADGLGLISYFDDSYDDLKVAHCSNAACSSASTYTLDSTGIVGWYTSIAIGADGFGLICYYDDTNDDLKVAHCSNATCSSASTYTLDSTGIVGWYTSIAIGPDGLGLISYYDATHGDLKVAHCSDTACSSALTYTLDSTGMVGWYTSIAIGADGLRLISYYDDTNDDLKVAHCNYATCSTATINTVDSTNYVGRYSSITIGVDGLGLISYYDDSYDEIRIAHCNNPVCRSATTNSLDSSIDNVGSYTSIAIGSDGLALISYYDATNLNLKVAHCSNELCIPINWEH